MANLYDFCYHQQPIKEMTSSCGYALVADKKNDKAILERVKKLFENDTTRYAPMHKSDMWQDTFVPMYQRLFEYLKDNNDEKALNFFNNMCINGATHGFFSPYKNSTEQEEPNYLAPIFGDFENQRMFKVYLMDSLVSLTEWLNIIPVESVDEPSQSRYIAFHPDYFFDLIDKKLGIEFKIPLFQDYSVGLCSKRGVFLNRHIIAFYLALRIKEFCKNIENPRVCEIGGGIGLLPYYLNLLGIKDVTSIDIPSVSMISTYWMIKNMPERSFLLSDDDKIYNSPESIKILFPEHFHNAPDNQFDVVINCDSMPEMHNDFIHEYLTTIRRTSKIFYSINREQHAEPARRNNVAYSIACSKDTYIERERESNRRFNTVFRNLFWLRRGYVEELYKIK